MAALAEPGKRSQELIKSNPGNITPGPTKETLDSTTFRKLEKMSAALKRGKYKFSPRRRVWIPKPGKKEKRPLRFASMASPMEKIVQKAIALILEAIYEPTFLPSSHGFRPSKGTHTALKMIDLEFKKCSWVIEADITKCFDSISAAAQHETLLAILQKRIRCQKTIFLIKSALQRGYIDLGSFVRSLKEGTPQGSILSPLLCNVYLHELDLYVASLIQEFNKGQTQQEEANRSSRGAGALPWQLQKRLKRVP